MPHTITVSEQVYHGLQRQATRHHKPMNLLVENWLKQFLDIAHHPTLEWRQGPGGWRIGIRETGIDVHTVVAYSQIGYTPAEISHELLPHLSLAQVYAALCYYADYPHEIDKILAESKPEAVKARLQRMLGPVDYGRLTGAEEQPAKKVRA